MNAPSVDIRHMLEDHGDSSGLDVEFGTNMFIGREPENPDICVTIFDTYGLPPALGLNYVGYEYPSVQIRVRHTHYALGWNLANEIKDALHGLSQTTWNGTLYTVIACVSGPAFLDWDEHNRCRFVLNFNLQRRSV